MNSSLRTFIQGALVSATLITASCEKKDISRVNRNTRDRTSHAIWPEIETYEGRPISPNDTYIRPQPSSNTWINDPLFIWPTQKEIDEIDKLLDEVNERNIKHKKKK